MQHAELLRVTPRNPLLAPLRFALPLRDFTNISVAVTGYKEGEKAFWLCHTHHHACFTVIVDTQLRVWACALLSMMHDNSTALAAAT